MKKTYLIFSLMLCLSVQVYAQKTAPFIIQGQLKNLKASEVFLTIRELNKKDLVDTIKLNVDGHFYLKTFKVKKSLRVIFSRNDAGFHTELFVSPGYNLTISANCIDEPTVQKSKKVEGKGAVPNLFLFKQDSIRYSNNDTRNWFELNANDLISFEALAQQSSDSLINLIFTRKRLSDPATATFYNLILLDKKYERLDHFTNYIVNDKNFTYDQSIAFIRNNCGKNAFANLYNPVNLKSQSYRTFMRDGYFAYLKALNRKRGVKYDRDKYNIENAAIISANYKDDVKQYALYNLLVNAARYARSFAELNLYSKALPVYIAQLTDNSKQNEINSLLAAKEKELITTQIGKPAPLLTAGDISGKAFTLNDLKGKVVLIDLWASWCGPCRQETPYLKKTFEKYKNDSRVAIISVAVLDKPDAWKKAMEDDKPTWLQLYDTDGSVQRNYVANSIPKFIVINKAGNIVSFDAPMPHTPDLEKMLLEEMNK